MEKVRILLVDDEERFLKTTQKLLVRKGYDILTAAGGAEALQILLSQTIHVVILDVKMPGMDALAVLKEIRTLHPLVEGIMLTGQGTVESAVEGLKSGATDFLVKPTDVDILIPKAEEAFEKRKKLEEKIWMAQSRSFMKSPREILRESQKF